MLDEKNGQMFQAGMLVCLRIGLENLTTASKDDHGKKYALLLADTVIVTEDGAQCLTDGVQRKPKRVQWNVGDEGEEPTAKKDEKKAKYCIERRTEGRTIYYKSIEAVLDALNQEAILARAALVAPEKFQESLESVPPGDEVVTMGSRWRLLETAPRLTDNGMRPNLPIHPDDKGKEKSDSDTITCYPGLAAVFSLGHDTFFEPSMDTAPPHCIIVKVCRLSNKILGGFEAFPRQRCGRQPGRCRLSADSEVAVSRFLRLAQQP